MFDNFIQLFCELNIHTNNFKAYDTGMYGKHQPLMSFYIMLDRDGLITLNYDQFLSLLYSVRFWFKALIEFYVAQGKVVGM